ncbi:hypothetical protein Vqi01_15250 [Micromonospora qiuiae]|uniref:LysM domain-containing protein n=2 Tax=Micromonospora qiuiae TaxID=502268 RepID=A0ABQ4J871_9ACTN|nr:hypothetical protein Vqi01_15250 [Micromonospora qiuiae]
MILGARWLAAVPLLVALTVVAPTQAAPARAVAAPRPDTGRTPPAPSQPEGQRYYVVGSPRDGLREHLYQIAATTLGDGNRLQEIFELNQGRLQPDGGRLTDPLSLQPGWILELPPDARGPGVRIGPPPFPPSAYPSGPAAADDPSRTSPYLVGAVALGAMALLLGAGLRLLRRRSAVRDPVPVTAASPDPEPVPATFATGPDPEPVPAASATGPAPEPSVSARPGRLVITLFSPSAEPGHVDVRLLGTDVTGAAATYGWLDDASTPTGRMPVVLGQRDGRRFHLDLAATPDLFTIGGPSSAAVRYALDIARQLLAADVAVTVVGNVLGPDVPTGCRRIDAFPSSTGLDTTNGPVVVFSGPLHGAEMTAARALTARIGSRVVPVLVGEVLRARWSVLLTPGGTEPAAGDGVAR